MKKYNFNLLSLVDVLADGQYHDGTTIGAQLEVTRSAIWKAIKKLQNYGISIKSIKNKGYVLTEPLVLLDKNKIKKGVREGNILIDVVESLESTNDYLKDYKDAKQERICLAEHQTKGKGRLKRSWHSPFGQNIYLSFFYSFQKDVSELAGLSLLISLAVVKTLKQYYAQGEFLVKWPNDVVYKGKKLAGSLIELQAEANGLSYAIIGIGVNVNMMHAKNNQINQEWTSLREISKTYIDRNSLCVSLINNLVEYIRLFEVDGFSQFMKEWQKADYLQDKQITVKCMSNAIQGIAKGISPQGNLLLQLKDGVIKAFSSGDTSIIKKKNYCRELPKVNA